MLLEGQVIHRDLLRMADRPSAALNLTTAIINLSNPAGSVVGYAKDLMRWLERQGVDDKAFIECAKLAKGLAYPNANGTQIGTSVIRADQKLSQLKIIPFKLWHSGALGRIMLKDPDYCYMVSTVATLITHHDLGYVTDALTSMLLDSGGHEDDCKPKYQILRAPTKAVVSQIVHSIHLNVTIAGHHSEPLPQMLAELHPHLLDDTTFAGLVRAIQETDSDLLLRTTRFPADLILWVLNHFEGKLVVYLGNEELFSQVLGTSAKEIKCMVKERCTDDTSLCERREYPVQLAEILNSSSTPVSKILLSGCTEPEPERFPANRCKLYTTYSNSSTHTAQSQLGKKLENDILSVAREMVIWLLGRTIEKGVASDIAVEPVGFVFSCPIEEVVSPDQKSQMCVEDLFRQVPGLLHKSTGGRIGTAPVFRPPEWHEDADADASDNSDFDFSGQQQQLEDLLRWFPAAEDLLDAARGRCHCRICRAEGPLHQCKSGCRRYSAVSELCTLLCHALADGFGVLDASGTFSSSDAISAIFVVFGDIIFEQVIRWDTWFKVAACVLTGCDWTPVADVTYDGGGTCWVGMQYGALLVTAPWLNSTFDLDLKGCFSVTVYEGIAQGITADIAFILSEATTPAETSFQGANPDLDEVDDTIPTEQLVIFRADAALFRRMALVTAAKSARVVDPASKMSHLSQSPRPSCRHQQPNDAAIPDNIRESLIFYNFPHIVKSWGFNTTDDPTRSLHASSTLDSVQKVSVALSLAYGGAILRDVQRCCWNCAYQLARSEPKGYIISYDFGTKRRLRLAQEVCDIDESND